MNVILDFDSTIIQAEGLDVLAGLCLEGDMNKINKVEQWTKLGMEGAVSFQVSLEKRLEILHAKMEIMPELIEKLEKMISPTLPNLLEGNRNFPANFYVVSGGFREYVTPICLALGFREENMIANQFTYEGGRITGFDSSLPISKSQGKVLAIRSLNLNGKCIMIGDGFTDYEVKRQGAVDYFIALTETVSRSNVVSNADFVCQNFIEVRGILDKMYEEKHG